MGRSAPLANGGMAVRGTSSCCSTRSAHRGARTVVWDEFYHGHARSLWSYIAATPLPFALIQLAAIATLALFTFARRRAPIRSRRRAANLAARVHRHDGRTLRTRRRAAAALSRSAAHVRRRLLDAAGLPLRQTTRGCRASRRSVWRWATASPATLARARAASADPALTPRQAVAARGRTPDPCGAVARRARADNEIDVHISNMSRATPAASSPRSSSGRPR